MLILTNAKIRTLWEGHPQAEAVAIEQGYFIAVGTNADIEALSRPGDTIRDLNGKTVWPGLTDSHIHLQHYAFFLRMIDCETPTREECINRVADAVKKARSGEWIRGHGWNQNVWPEGFGTAALLDEVAPNNPVFLTSKSLHTAWVNTKALNSAGINRHTPDPQGGIIQRDRQGNLTGILFEAAMDMLEKSIPAPSTTEIKNAIKDAQSMLLKLGLTGVHDFDPRSCFLALQEMEQAGTLHLRVVKGIPLENLTNAVSLGVKTGFGSNLLCMGSVKLFTDGALGPQNAAMLQPYEGSSDTGMLLMDSEQIFEIGQRAAESGISLAIHAIGDRANYEVLKAYEQLRRYETENNKPHLRHRVEHVQILHPDHVGRLAALGVIASMQPIHATSDYLMADRFWGERSRSAYALRELLVRGTSMTFGSDAPVESPNPFWGLHAAVTRRRQDSSPGPSGWYPHQRLTLQQAFEGYTIGPAYTSGRENRLGRIAPGYLADLIVLDEDPFDMEPDLLFTIQPSATMVSGQFAWEK